MQPLGWLNSVWVLAIKGVGLLLVLLGLVVSLRRLPEDLTT